MAVRKPTWFTYLKIGFDRQKGYVSIYQLAINFQTYFAVGGKLESWMFLVLVVLTLWGIFDIKYIYPSEQATNYDNHPLKTDIARLEAKIEEIAKCLNSSAAG